LSISKLDLQIRLWGAPVKKRPDSILEEFGGL
jgi:hypothetical protein